MVGGGEEWEFDVGRTEKDVGKTGKDVWKNWKNRVRGWCKFRVIRDRLIAIGPLRRGFVVFGGRGRTGVAAAGCGAVISAVRK